FRRRLVAAQQVAGPAREPVDQVVVGVLRRTADQHAVLDLFRVLVLRPAVATLAERDFVPLSGLVIVAGLGVLLAVPHLLHARLEYVAHVGGAHAVEAAQPHAAVIVHRNGLVDHRAGYSLGWLDHVREGAVLEHDAHADDVDDADPAV